MSFSDNVQIFPSRLSFSCDRNFMIVSRRTCLFGEKRSTSMMNELTASLNGKNAKV